MYYISLYIWVSRKRKKRRKLKKKKGKKRRYSKLECKNVNISEWFTPDRPNEKERKKKNIEIIIQNMENEDGGLSSCAPFAV